MEVTFAKESSTLHQSSTAPFGLKKSIILPIFMFFLTFYNDCLLVTKSLHWECGCPHPLPSDSLEILKNPEGMKI